MAELLRSDSDLQTLRAELTRLTDEHEALEVELSGFEGRLYLTQHDQMERKRLQKLKLRAKDRIHQISRQLEV